MAQPETIILAGLGISGTVLSYELMRHGFRVLVVDSGQEGSSTAAAGIINPVGGKKLWRTRIMEESLPVALETYAAMSRLLSIPPLQSWRLAMMPVEAERASYLHQRAREEPTHFETAAAEETAILQQCFAMPYGAALIHPYYQVKPWELLPAWRSYLASRGYLIEEKLNWDDVTYDTEIVSWQGFQAKALINCAGAAVRCNPHWAHLRWTPNKGEALILSIPDLPQTMLYQKELRLAPWKDGLWWAGTRQSWDFKDALPSKAWRQEAVAQLKEWLQIPFELVDHLAAERPTIAGQRPVAMMHPTIPRLGIFNGMGSRGFANAPYYARQLARLLQGLPG